MSFLEARNKSLDGKFSGIASDYARLGDELQIRWDTAFFQMLLETGNLTFTGDVSPDQNNFAGLGATGKKAPGETFPDVATGVKAHLQHLLMYAGEKVDDPVAERTRKVQEWGVLTSWQKTVSGPMTYAQIAKKWAPGSRSYAHDIETVADSFFDGICKQPDPKPELLAQSKDETPAPAAAATATPADPTTKISGTDLAKRAADDARATGTYVRSSLGAGMLANLNPFAGAAAETQTAPAVTIINAPKVEVEATTSDEAATPAASLPAETIAKVQTAALGAAIKPAVGATPAKSVSKCKVWTASYGGSRAVIIKAAADDQDNFTVLDVNEGTEQREADAYIQAYAKGGKKVGDYQSTTQALDKAFELCPEG